VIDVAWPNTEDIDLDRHLDAPVLDGHVKRCASAVTNALKTPPPGYSKDQAVHLCWMFDAMRFTHVTIRNLIALGTNSPSCVDSLALGVGVPGVLGDRGETARRRLSKSSQGRGTRDFVLGRGNL